MSDEERKNKSGKFPVLPMPYGKADMQDGRPLIPPCLGVLPLGTTVVYPHMVAPLTVSLDPSVKLIKDANNGNGLIALVAQKKPDMDYPEPENLYSVGTVAKIVKMIPFPNDVIQIWVHGISRIRLTEFVESDVPYIVAGIEVISDEGESDMELEALARNVHDLLGKIANLSEEVSDELVMMARGMEPSATADIIAMYLNTSIKQKQKMLETTNVSERLSTLRSILARELSVLELSSKIQSEAKDEMDKAQREFYLRKKMGAIRKELGEDDEVSELGELKKRIKEAGMPPEAEKQAKRELSR